MQDIVAAVQSDETNSQRQTNGVGRQKKKKKKTKKKKKKLQQLPKKKHSLC
jgi:hypothetical protein